MTATSLYTDVRGMHPVVRVRTDIVLMHKRYYGTIGTKPGDQRVTNLLWIYPTLPTPYPLRVHVRHIHRRLVAEQLLGTHAGHTRDSAAPETSRTFRRV